MLNSSNFVGCAVNTTGGVLQVPGCMDYMALNWNPSASFQVTGSCLYGAPTAETCGVDGVHTKALTVAVTGANQYLQFSVTEVVASPFGGQSQNYTLGCGANYAFPCQSIQAPAYTYTLCAHTNSTRFLNLGTFPQTSSAGVANQATGTVTISSGGQQIVQQTVQATQTQTPLSCASSANGTCSALYLKATAAIVKMTQKNVLQPDLARPIPAQTARLSRCSAHS